MSIYNILNKLNSLMPKPDQSAKLETKPIYESVEPKGSIKEGLEQRLTERYLAEKAVSKSQQQAAGAALAAKRGETSKKSLKGASKEMLGMSTKELEKFAGTKHAGLPKKKKATEGVDVSDIPAALRKQKGYPDLTVNDLKKSKGNLSDRRTLEKMPGGETGRYRKELDEQGQKEIDYSTLEIDGIDYRDAPEFSDAYFSDGYYTDGTPLSDRDLEQLSNDGDLVYQYVEKFVYEGKMGDMVKAGAKKLLKPVLDKDREVTQKNAQKERDRVLKGLRKTSQIQNKDGSRSVMSEASDYMNDLVKFAKVVRSVQTPEQLKVAQRMGNNLLQKYRDVPDGKLDQISKFLGHDTSMFNLGRSRDVEDELYAKKKEMGLSESAGSLSFRKFVRMSLKEAAGRVHRGKYGTEYQGDDEPTDGEEAPRKRGRPAKGEVRKPKAEPTGEKRGRGRPKKATDPKYAGAKDLQSWIVGNVPKTAKNLGKKTKHTLPDTVNESVMMVEAGALDHVLNRFKHEVKQFQNSGQLDDDLYQALFDFYLDAGEMPYGVAKARTGDPYAWVTDRLSQDLGMPATNEVAMAETGDMDLELNELARLAGLSVAESAKPDYIDLDKDGDKSEPMKKAAADKKAAGKKVMENDDDEGEGFKDWESNDDEYDGHADEMEFQKWLKKSGKTEFGEGEMEEGNEFSGALAKAKASGAKEFKVDGKTYPVKEQQIDELSSDTLKSYMDKAGGDIYKTGPGNRGDMSDEERRKQNTRFGGPGQGSGTRFQGHRRAGEKLLGKEFAAEADVAECGGMPAGTDDSSLNVSTNMSSTGDKSVTVSASGEQAEALLAMLKMAGLGDSSTAQSLTQPATPVEVSMEEEYVNEPDTEIQPVDAIVHQGNDLNREKRQYADKPRAGDNPMATTEQVNPLESLGRKLMQAYESIKAKK